MLPDGAGLSVFLRLPPPGRKAPDLAGLWLRGSHSGPAAGRRSSPIGSFGTVSAERGGHSGAAPAGDPGLGRNALAPGRCSQRYPCHADRGSGDGGAGAGSFDRPECADPVLVCFGDLYSDGHLFADPSELSAKPNARAAHRGRVNSRRQGRLAAAAQFVRKQAGLRSGRSAGRPDRDRPRPGRLLPFVAGRRRSVSSPCLGLDRSALRRQCRAAFLGRRQPFTIGTGDAWSASADSGDAGDAQRRAGALLAGPHVR